MEVSFSFPSQQTPQAAGAVSCQDPASQRGPGVPLSFNCCWLGENQVSPSSARLRGQAMYVSAQPRLIRRADTLYSAAAVQSDAKQFAHLPVGRGNPVIPEQSCVAPATAWFPSTPSQHWPQKPQVPIKSYSTRVVQFIVHHWTVWHIGEIWPWALILSALASQLL